jgi:hypothetical protein
MYLWLNGIGGEWIGWKLIGNIDKEDVMTKLELLNMLERGAKEYRLDANVSLNRSIHMNDLKPMVNIPQKFIDALLVDFINFVGRYQGVDYALYTSDLIKDREEM